MHLCWLGQPGQQWQQPDRIWEAQDPILEEAWQQLDQTWEAQDCPDLSLEKAWVILNKTRSLTMVPQAR